MTESNNLKEEYKVQHEYRINCERRKITRRTIDANSYYLEQENRCLPDRRKAIRRSCDRASNWRRRFWRDQQRKRFEKFLETICKNKKDNMLFSDKRILIARKQAREKKAQDIKQLKLEKERLAKSLGLQYELDINVPAQLILNQWQLQLSNMKEDRGEKWSRQLNKKNTNRKMQFYKK